MGYRHNERADRTVHDLPSRPWPSIIRAMNAVRPRASFHTLGCRLNQAETGMLADQLRRKGYQLVDSGQPTDLLVINTCSVTEQAEKECRAIVRKTLQHSPNAFVAVTGCYAQTGMQSLQQVPGIDLIVGTQYKMALPEHLPVGTVLPKESTALVLHTKHIDHEEFTLPGTGDCDLTRAPLKIQDGCNFMCSFCLIPFARGRERSRNVDDAIREAIELVQRGHREVVLTGVNIGRHNSRHGDLVDLIQRLEQIDGLDRIRISSIEPTTISERLLDHMASSSKLCPFLHIPLQSGDDKILQAMNRQYMAAEYRALIEKASSRIPHLGLGADVMVGFPGEGSNEFDATVRLIEELPFSYLHVFTFSKRPGTAAARLRQAVPSSIVKTRATILAKLSQAKRLAFYQRYLGRPVHVLFEKPDRAGFATGRTGNFIKVEVPSSEDLWNSFREVIITGVMDGLAMGYLAPSPTSVRERALV